MKRITILFLLLLGCSQQLPKAYREIKNELLAQTNYLSESSYLQIKASKLPSIIDDNYYYYLFTFDSASTMLADVVILIIPSDEKENLTNTLYPSIGILTPTITLASDNTKSDELTYPGTNLSMISKNNYDQFLVYLTFFTDHLVTNYLKITAIESN